MTTTYFYTHSFLLLRTSKHANNNVLIGLHSVAWQNCISYKKSNILQAQTKFL